MTIAAPDVSGSLKALAGVQVVVNKRDTSTGVPIFQRHDGTAQGPTAESGASGGPNPFLTGASGVVEFWSEGPAELDIAISDTAAPARIAPRVIGWNCMPAANGSLPGDLLASDASIDLTNLGSDILRQLHQVGEVIDWWRPADSVPIPSGFEICDGRLIPAGQHDFPGLSASAINLPDLRNAFILGADPTKARGTGANQGNAGTDGPGVAGSGGSNAAKNLQADLAHTHKIPDHSHALSGSATSAGAHTHPASSAGWRYIIADGSISTADATSHSPAIVNHVPYTVPACGVIFGSFGTARTYEDVAATGSGGAHTHPLSGTAGAGANANTNPATQAANWGSAPGSDLRPQYVGLIKLMKVRRS
jgi:hypothetical protein